MILTCPACDTRYRVGEEDLAVPDGRTVRCANCGYSWRQAPPGTEARADEAAFSAAASERPPRRLSASRLEFSPRPPPASPLTIGQRRLGLATLGRGAAIVLVAVVLAVLAGIIASRHPAAIWAAAGRLSTSIDLPDERTGAGLAIEQVAAVRTGDGLMINGEIANRRSTPENVPRLRVALQDAAKQEVQFKVVDPPKARLQPGEIVHFTTPFARPADHATGVVVTFAAH